MEGDKSSSHVPHSAATGAVVTGCIRNEVEKIFNIETKRPKAWKRHIKKVMKAENEWNGSWMPRVDRQQAEVGRAIEAVKLRKAASDPRRPMDILPTKQIKVVS